MPVSIESSRLVVDDRNMTTDPGPRNPPQFAIMLDREGNPVREASMGVGGPFTLRDVDTGKTIGQPFRDPWHRHYVTDRLGERPVILPLDHAGRPCGHCRLSHLTGSSVGHQHY